MKANRKSLTPISSTVKSLESHIAKLQTGYRSVNTFTHWKQKCIRVIINTVSSADCYQHTWLWGRGWRCEGKRQCLKAATSPINYLGSVQFPGNQTRFHKLLVSSHSLKINELKKKKERESGVAKRSSSHPAHVFISISFQSRFLWNSIKMFTSFYTSEIPKILSCKQAHAFTYLFSFLLDMIVSVIFSCARDVDWHWRRF